MRSLQRQRADRFPPREVAPGRSEVAPPPERRAVSIAAVLLALALGAAAVAVPRALRGRVVADARLCGFQQVLRAPAAVRVLEVRAAAGVGVAAGQVLVVLEPLRGAPRVRAAEVAVERARARMRALEQGGRLEDLDLGLRVERTLEARGEALAAAARRDVRAAEVAALERERARVELEARLAREDRADAQVAFAARRAEATARIERVAEQGELRALEVERYARLAADGLVPELALAERRAERQAALRAREELTAALEAVALDQAAERASLERDGARAGAALEALDGELEAARRRLAEAEAHVERWESLARERACLAPADAGALGELREREREFLRLDLEAARAELAAALEAGGGGQLCAEFRGRVEDVFVVPGALLAAGEPLLAYVDDGSPSLVAYLRPDDVHAVQRGDACTLVPEDGSEAFVARVAAVAPRLATAPAQLAPGAGAPTDLRLELRLACDDPARLVGLPIDLRFKAVFGGLVHGDGP